MDRDEQRL
ncbi:109b3b42-2e25-422c-8a5c-6d8b535ed567 [Thermothielavioides terrestris]|uniref:109b3b42-2e25-422c-8a5c-6d8b535ed567 n=1 Tax=Thermothielavioides terrestris TaxID=2587410 RepID=A0A3S4BAW2_9PEZI|nr:109b3b42-2e25-422c-8a5c-6d8b535ed567 [Thermothielavioides terrestris]